MECQKNGLALPEKADFLEQVLTKIGGEKPQIMCKPPSPSKLNLTFFKGVLPVQAWKQMLDTVMRQFEDNDEQLAFLASISDPATPAAVPDMVGAHKTTLKGLKKALNHLDMTNTYFETLATDASLQTIVPKQLYFKTTCEGSGKELGNASRVRVGYVIADLQGEILFANHDIWLNLTQTIPGFAHGLQGMRLGEKRQLFIHPALAYGVLTTLPPCMGLVVNVQLLAMDDSCSRLLPALTPLDLNWIQNPSFYRTIEESVQRQPRFVGAFYRHMLDKVEGSSADIVIAALSKEAQ
jgi:peptidylprolyl isomerase